MIRMARPPAGPRDADCHLFTGPATKRFPGQWICTKTRPWDDDKAPPHRAMDVVHVLTPEDFAQGRCPTCGRECSKITPDWKAGASSGNG